MTDLIQLAEEEISAGWAWVTTEAKGLYDAISPLVAKALSAFEGTVVQQLWSAAAAFVQKVLGATSLVDIETAFLNTIGHLWPNLLSAAQVLGSILLQSILGVFHTQVNQGA
jgi:hypothetical protein